MTLTATAKLDPIRHRLPRRERSDTFAARWPGRPQRPRRLPGEITAIRLAGQGDVDALTRFYESLDGDSRYRRFLQPVPRVSPAMATHILTPPNRVLVAVDHEGAIVAEVVFAPSRRADAHPEIAYAVAPSHRRRGLARTMVRQTLAEAARAGEVAVEALIGSDNAASIALMRSFGARTRFDDGAIVAHLELDAARFAPETGTGPTSDVA